MIKQNLLKELRLIVGKENVLSSPEDLVCYSYDAAPLPADNLPDAVVLPSSTEEAVNLLHLAKARGIKVVPRGSGTNLSGGTIPIEGGIIIQLTRMSRILEIDSHNLTATVEPGVITRTLHSAVEQVGLFYPPDPASANVSTIGGNVAECAGGLRGLKYGTTKDYVIGLETVLASGEVLVTGGKTVKNVAGYDLTKLMIGSEGTLGIFTKIILRLIPLPETKKTLLILYPNFQAAASSVSEIIANRILPTTLEFLDKVTINCVEAHTHIGLPRNAEAILLIEVDGSKWDVEREAEKVVEICSRHQPLEVKLALTPSEAMSLTLARRSALASLSRVRPTTILEDVTVPPSRLTEMIIEIKRIVQRQDIQVGIFGHAGDGNLHPTFLTNERDEAEMKRVEAAIREVFEVTLKLEGTISGEHGIGLTKARFLPWQVKPLGLKVMKIIKEGFDPENILNPGKIFTGYSP
ncbi:MAG: putative FAD-linked oxidoreductase [Firmicutes bacterium]|nr:putative FAD-linked oxidoreductase [Bacillota bacterium]